MIEFTTVQTEAELQQLYTLMQANLLANITAAVAQDQGFVTIPYELDLLRDMNTQAPHIIAKDGDQVVGYALTASPRVKHPFFDPLLETLSTLTYKNKPLSESSYYLMGQVCVAEGYRGRGIFDGMYQQHRKTYSADFDYLITDISVRNTRSQAAHRRVGFQPIHTFTDSTATHDTWVVVLWDWTC
ncbi:hypothetical protein BWI96_03575 [Siphonobacter sp. SORGH_AS_0500]|nr:hypothetical protein BWI96_03575 [Siphonobacter sp. SORGH_AS_0500]